MAQRATKGVILLFFEIFAIQAWLLAILRDFRFLGMGVRHRYFFGLLFLAGSHFQALVSLPSCTPIEGTSYRCYLSCSCPFYGVHLPLKSPSSRYFHKLDLSQQREAINTENNLFILETYKCSILTSSSFFKFIRYPVGTSLFKHSIVSRSCSDDLIALLVSVQHGFMLYLRKKSS